ncbi:MAG: hypothetical protein ACRCWF_10650 [Beijerinckiaceae bacterium]
MTKQIKNVACLILENKGGCKKSHIAACLYEYGTLKGKKIMMIDTDTSNSTSTLSYGAKFAAISDKKNEGVPMEVAEMLLDDEIGMAIFDFGAREEIAARKALDRMHSMFKGSHCAVLAVRPITLDVFVQNSALQFVEEVRGTQIPILLLRAECGGETAEEFEAWNNSNARAKIDDVVSEAPLVDFTSYIISNSKSFRMKISDLAMSDFSRVDKRHLEQAKSVFPRHRQLFVRETLGEQLQILHEAVPAAFAKRGLTFVP